MNIPDNIKSVLDRLKNAGFEAYVVGGCVRDSVMGETPHDYDVTTSALPEQVSEVFSDMKVIETGIKHGTVTVVSNKENVEVTTFRIDGKYEDNRRPKDVVFTKSLEEDLARRDFTVNAMAYSDDGGIVDIFGGREDIENKLIRCVGDPDRRFNEDGLRILRALRFASVLGFGIEDETSDSIVRNKDLLKNISVERIFSEFQKLLCGKGAARICALYADVICVFIPEMEPSVGFPQINRYHFCDVYSHILKALDVSRPERIIRLAVFFHDIGKPASFKDGHFTDHPNIGAVMTEKILRRLHADNETTKLVTKLVLYHDRDFTGSDRAAKRMLRLVTFDEARMLVEVRRSDILAHTELVITKELPGLEPLLETIDRLEQENSCVSLKTLAIGGRELIEMGMKPGGRMGGTLDRLLDAVIDEEIPNEREALIKYAQKLIDEEKQG